MAVFLLSLTNIWASGALICRAIRNQMLAKLTTVSAESSVRMLGEKGTMQKQLIYGSLGGLIRRERTKLQMNQDELARRVGLSRTSVTNVELGRQGLAVHQLFEFADALGVEPCELLPDKQIPEPPAERSVTPELSEWVASLKSKSMRL